MSELRNSESELVQIQVEVFDEKLHRDQSELEKDPRSLSPQQLFDIISNKVRGSSFFKGENYEIKSSVIWKFSPHIRFIISRNVRWAGHVACIGTMINYKILVRNPAGKGSLGRRGDINICL